MNLDKAPFPWFGGKSAAANEVWAALGDVDHYVEPFAGSLAVLLRRPHPANRTYHSETVNDLDGLIVNAWRSIVLHPDATAEAASWPVAEADLHARHLAIVRWREGRDVERLMGDPAFCDPLIAGWWLWGVACWIGSGWASGTGPWTADSDGRLHKQPPGPREAGVSRRLPHLGDDGQGVNRPGLREAGVERKLPHIGNNGIGVNHAGLREAGVKRTRPHLANNGQGVNHAVLREAGVDSEGDVAHEMTMPGLRRWFEHLAARLRHVRILNGDWQRAVTSGATQTITVRMGGHAGIFLDPPYADTAGRDAAIYTVDSLDVAHNVRRWCLDNGTNPRLRIVLAGFDGEHGTDLIDAGWSEVEWFKKGFLKGGMGNVGEGGQQHRERLWLSPHCLRPHLDTQLQLWAT